MATNQTNSGSPVYEDIEGAAANLVSSDHSYVFLNGDLMIYIDPVGAVDELATDLYASIDDAKSSGSRCTSPKSNESHAEKSNGSLMPFDDQRSSLCPNEALADELAASHIA